MNRREAIAGMIGAVAAASLPAIQPVIVSLTAGRTIVTFFRDGVVMGRYSDQTEAQGKPLEYIWRENGCRISEYRIGVGKFSPVKREKLVSGDWA